VRRRLAVVSLVFASVVVASVVGASWLRGQLADPAEMIGMEDFLSLPDTVQVVVVDAVDCRGSGRQGFLYKDVGLEIFNEGPDLGDLEAWLILSGLERDDVQSSGALRLSDSRRRVELWPIAEYENAYLSSKLLRSQADRLDVVLRMWPSVPCEI